MTASLTVLSGPLAGRRLDIDDSADEILVGSDPDCGLALDLPEVSPIHARLWLDDAGVTVYDTRSPRGLFVNDARVEGQSPLRDGDVLWLGTPGDDASVMIQCRISRPTVAAPPPSMAESVLDEAPAEEPAVAEPSLMDELERPAAPDPDLPPIPIVPDSGDAEVLTEAWAEQGLAATPPPEEASSAEDVTDVFEEAQGTADVTDVLEEAQAPSARRVSSATPAGGESDPMRELGDFAMPAATDSPDAAEVAPSSAAQETPGDDVFFVEESAPSAAPDEPLAEPMPAPPPEPPPAPASLAPPPAPPEEDLFFVEEPEQAPVPPPAPPPAAPVTAVPPPAPPISPPMPPVSPPVASAVAAPPPKPPRVTAAAPRPPASSAPTPAAPSSASGEGSSPAPRSRRPGPTPPPSMAPESEEEAEARPRAAVPTRAPASAPAPSRRPALPMGLIAGAAGLALVVVIGSVLFLRSGKTPAIESITPPRVGVGQSITIAGTHFGDTAQANAVQFGGKPGRVVQASATRLQVEVPELAASPGRDTPVPVVVVVDGHESKAATIGVFEAPRVRGIAPGVGMPGDEVVLTGAGWGPGAKVQFGAVSAAVLDSSPVSLKVRVPALEAAPGTEFPVRVAMGADTSNPTSFVLGRLPLVLGVAPLAAGPGDLVTLSGRGFEAKPLANDVRVGGAHALVLTSNASELKVVVPRTAAGEAVVEVRTPGVDNVGQSKMSVTAGADPIDFRFVAEPFEDVAGHDHAQLSTGLGPAFVLSASNGRSAAERALEAARRLNEAGTALKASIDTDVRVRGLDGSPTLVLAGKDTPLLEVTLDDAAAYQEDWTGLKGRGEAVTAARLALWWEAVARDLVLLLVRGDKPHLAADLSPEGRVFADLHALARKSVAVGVPRQLMADGRSPMRDALRTVALRVPPAVRATAGGAAAAGAGVSPEGAAAVSALKLEGRWSGTETESGTVKYITATFAGNGGSFTYQRALSLTVPLQDVAQQKGAVRFSVQTGAGPRYYQGRWDGQKLTGTISLDPGGRTATGTFELAPG